MGAKYDIKKTGIYHYIVKSTIVYAADNMHLKPKPIAELNSTDMDFWSRSARTSRRDKFRNIVTKQKIQLTGSLLDGYSGTAKMAWTCPENGGG